MVTIGTGKKGLGRKGWLQPPVFCGTTEGGHPCLVLDLRQLSTCPVSVLAVGLICMLHCIKICSFVEPTLFTAFTLKGFSSL